MTKHGLGREQIHAAAWGESYPHPLVSCFMPLFAILVIGGVMMFGMRLWQLSLPQDTRVPSVEGLQLEQAQADLRSAGLAVEVMKDREYSEDIPAGAIISTSPVAGRLVKKGRLVRLLLSNGSGYTSVPDVRELPEAMAKQRLAAADLLITAEDYQFHKAIPFDRVISITPKQGAKVKRATTVSLVLSKGPETNDLAASSETRSTVVSVDVPNDVAGSDTLRIDVTDDSGTRSVYEETRNPGEKVTETVQGTGAMTIEVYFGSRKLLTRKF